MTSELRMTGLDATLGLVLTEITADRVVAELEITDALLQPYGIVHGGVYCSVIESVASIGGATWFGDRGVCVGVNNSTNFLRSARIGRLIATGTPIHRGRTQQLWQVSIADSDGRAIATGQVRLANVTDLAAIGGQSS